MPEPMTIGDALDIALARADSQIASLDESIARSVDLRSKMVEMREKILSIRATASEHNFLSSPAPPDAVADFNKGPTVPMWMIIGRLMGGKVKFTMTEAGEALERELRRSLGKNRPQLVRNNLLRHSETFRRNNDGTWTVIANEKEAPMPETS